MNIDALDDEDIFIECKPMTHEEEIEVQEFIARYRREHDFSEVVADAKRIIREHDERMKRAAEACAVETSA